MMAQFIASTPFPVFQKGSSLELLDCVPKTWDVITVTQRITAGSDGMVFCCTLVLVDSQVLEDVGWVVKKQSGAEVGPSGTRFGRISS